MNTIIQGLNANVGFISFILMIGVTIIAGRSLSKSKVNEDANNAQQRAINAMNAELATLRSAIEEEKRDNKRLKRVIDTIRLALEKRGLTITISDEAIDIEDSKRSTTIRIRNEEDK